MSLACRQFSCPGEASCIFTFGPEFSKQGISGLVVEYIVAIDVTRVRFPADATLQTFSCHHHTLGLIAWGFFFRSPQKEPSGAIPTCPTAEKNIQGSEWFRLATGQTMPKGSRAVSPWYNRKSWHLEFPPTLPRPVHRPP